ncbi:MAG TPA: VIT domain-containing protein [Nannocystis sp.]
MRNIPLVVRLALPGLMFSCTGSPGPAEGSQSSGECSLLWNDAGGSSIGVAPFSLTTQDGTGLELVELVSRAHVEDPLAFTELHLSFRNPNDRVIEGRFEINLPPNSAISRFAMKIGGRWQEAEVVELQAARAAYEDALHRKVDPALLEKAAGNRFSARVFPIPADDVKEIIVAYSEELTASGAPYRVYLRGLPKLQSMDVEVVVPRPGAAPERTRVTRTDFMPEHDLELSTPRRSSEVGLRFDRLVVARIAPDIKLPDEPLTGVTLLFDTSASRALDFKGQVARLMTLIKELRAANGTDFPLTVAAFDQSVEVVFTGAAEQFESDAVQALLKRGPLGASDLTGALRWAATQKLPPRVIIVGDGVATAGDTGRDALRKAASDLAGAGAQRLDAVVDGGLRDDSVLRQLTTAALPQAGIVVDGGLPAPLVASRLKRATRANVAVRVPGATWVWPSTLASVQPGDQFLVFADLPADQAMRVELGAGEDVREPVLTSSTRPLLERAWIRASIERLSTMLGEEPEAKADLVKQIVEMSTRYRVLSDYTALLVLETEQDYERFGIPRTALAEILTVGPDGITVVDRNTLPRKPGEAPWVVLADRDFEYEDDEQDEPRTQLDLVRAPLDRLLGIERAHDPEDDPIPEDQENTDEEAGGSSHRHRGEEGRMGKPVPHFKRGLYAMKGPGDVGPPSEEASDGRFEEEAIEADTKRGPPQSREVASAAHVEAEPPGEPRMDDRPTPSPAKKRVSRDPPARRRSPVTSEDSDGPITRPTPTFEKPRKADPWEGRFAAVMAEIGADRDAAALAQALAWRASSPGDEIALIALGEAAEASGDLTLAARAYGSLIDLFPGRADLRRMAGAHLEALGEVGLALAIDTYRQAVAQRPDHPASHRLLAFALSKAGRHAEAFAAALAGAQRSYPPDRFAGVQRILREDLALLAAAWRAAQPGDKAMLAALAQAGVKPDTRPSLRFVLNWETDANDVDFHVYDGKGGHAYYVAKLLPGAGELYDDVRTGYGPECFAIAGEPDAFPYQLQAHYYSRGPMGYGMGKLQAIEHDGEGKLVFKEHPFVIMKDRAFVDLGRVDAPLAKLPADQIRLPSGAGEGKAPVGTYTPPPPPMPAR